MIIHTSQIHCWDDVLHYVGNIVLLIVVLAFAISFVLLTNLIAFAMLVNGHGAAMTTLPELLKWLCL